MVIKYEENRIYTAECNICHSKYSTQKESQTEMENFLKSNCWAVWKSSNAHQPNVACPRCKARVELAAKNFGFK